MGNLWPTIRKRRFVCFIYSNGLDNINLGLSINLSSPNIEIHLPFSFIRIGWQGTYDRPEKPPFSFGKEYFGWAYGRMRVPNRR